MAEDFNGKADYIAALRLVASKKAGTKEGATYSSAVHASTISGEDTREERAS